MTDSIQYRVLQPGDEDDLELFLRPRMSSSMFLLNNMRAVGLVDNGHTYEGTYVAAYQNGHMVAVVAHCWNQHLVVQAPVQVEALWSLAVQASQRPLKGVIGPDEQVTTILSQLNLTPVDLRMDEPEKLYSLALDALRVPAILTEGKAVGRRMVSADLDTVTAWRIAYSLEILNERDTPALRNACRLNAEQALARGLTWLLMVDGETVAMSSVNARIDEAVQIGGVYTPPAGRRRGYGRAIVAASLLDIRVGSASSAILFTGIDNYPAQKAYEALGFQLVGNYRLALFKRALTL